MKNKKINTLLHIIGLSTTFTSVLFVLTLFIGEALFFKITFLEPNAYILGAEITLFIFSSVYAGWLVKKTFTDVLKKMVWEQQKKEFYQ